MAYLSIAISTYADRISKLSLDFNPSVEYIIVHQKPLEASLEAIKNLKDRDDVSYIPTDTNGLSISRNIALENANGEYVMIMDDDVVFSIEKILDIIKRMKKDNVDVGTYYHRYQDGRTTLNSQVSHKLNFFTIAKPSSIDICFNRKVILNNKIRFDEKFGLGTENPSGEEMIFLSDCLSHGLSIQRYPVEVSSHPPVTSGADFYSTDQKIIAKKNMFLRVSPRCGLFLFILFVVKKSVIAYKAGFGFFFIKTALKSTLWRG
ncbi:putative glycosyl transferase [compost metagenome]